MSLPELSSNTVAASPDLPPVITDHMLDCWIWGTTTIDPEEAAELQDIVPSSVDLRESGVALICTLVPTETKPVVLPAGDDKNACIRALFSAALAYDMDKSIFNKTTFIAQIDCQDLRLCLVAHVFPNLKIVTASFCVTPLPELSATHAANPALRAEVDSLVKLYTVAQEYSAPSFVLARFGQSSELDFERALRDAPPNSVTHQLSRHSSLTIRPPTARLCDRMGVRVGRVFKRTTYEIDSQGSFWVEQKSLLHSDREGATVQVGATVGLQPEGTASVEKKLANTTYRRVGGEAALGGVIAKMDHSNTLRWWFLSMLLTGHIWVDKQSKADGFIPESIPRKEGAGLRLDQPLPAWYFEELGGAVFNICGNVFFRGHSSAKPKKVQNIDDYGAVRVSSVESPKAISVSDAAFYWRMRNLEVGLRA